ncbi:hypothetical protein AB0J94_04805 [Micromonospora noduli]|uniref:Uncharacterized protein n=1 Tax=Micromonospora noduli TaxID=709876 RepID=A0A328N1P8_9ACTN|nr:hypothetical protein [Micromonospora noduli]KAB1920390.1 hypothetical protein F8280_23665 [Micromonospora noduli]RAN95341.1 hypothetical protein LAH08_05540 [Micromonospora noduli]RAO15769.1 hypothetical protein GUI43_01532 [Micromonospora noduli]RAO18901.1 hypothetical protein LUPAC07_02597 [Micromonospora noduli]RAO35706.1 hypothetical protein ONO23_02309 [Micromonospora noduli]
MPGLSAELVQQLYRTPPDRFVAARDAAVAEARRAGDPTTARQLARLRRPTVAAWLVNLLAIRRPELVADLVQLADALRVAQRELRGPRLRELSAQRRAVVGALVAEVRKLAAAEPDAPPASRLPLAEVEATLNAAFSDAEVAEQVRAGRLLRAASYAGFGEVPRPQLRLVTDDDEEREEERPARRPGPQRGRPEAAPRTDRAAERAEQAERAAQRAARAERARQRRALDRELAKAQADQERAETELTEATGQERDGAAVLDRLEAELAELERRRAVAEQDLSRAKLARRAAERAVTVARRRAGEVEAAVEALAAEEGDADAGGGAAD